MPAYQVVLYLFLVFFALHLAVETIVSVLNARYLHARRAAIPEALRQAYSAETHERSIAYALARSRFGHVDRAVSALFTFFFLFSSFIMGLDLVAAHLALGELTDSVLVLVLFVLTTAAVSLPLELYATFRLEARFGFNKTTAGTFWLDKLKGLFLLLVLGVPFLYALLALILWTGPLWWLWAGLFVIGFQFLIMVLFPGFIAPLFNRFTPLQEGDLKTQLEALARACGFAVRGISVVDGSRRSAHSNAYFTGLGRWRRIALFDTLIARLSVPQLVAVLAHEIGHYKRKHILKMLALSAALTLAGCYVLSLLLYWHPIYQAFSVGTPTEAKGLVILALTAGHCTFWMGPLLNRLLRRHEYEADAYAAAHAGGPEPMASALLKIYAENLAAPAPHPLYSAYHYSHPTLLERIEALRSAPPSSPPYSPQRHGEHREQQAG